MRFLYTTDLHGHTEKYETVLKYAIEHKIKMIHLGADLLPKGQGMIKTQKKFIKGYLKNFYAECERNNIKVVAFFGNDDLYTRKKYFQKYADLLDEVSYRRSGFVFKAYPYVPDLEFPLKNGVKLDRYGLEPTKMRPRLARIPMFGNIVNVSITPKPVDIGSKGFYQIENLEEYFRHKGTVEDDLHGLRAGSKTIMAVHTPPSGLNLDVCGLFKKKGKPTPIKKVGSDALLRWIIKKQPLLVLCGHIHENFIVTGSWRAAVGKTTIIQPGQHLVWKDGQKKKTTFVVIDVNGIKVDAERYEI